MSAVNFASDPKQLSLRREWSATDVPFDNWEIQPKPVYSKPRFDSDRHTETSEGWGIIEHPANGRVIESIAPGEISIRPSEITVMKPTRHELHTYWFTRGSSSSPFLLDANGELYPDIRVLQFDPGHHGVAFASGRFSGVAAPLNSFVRQNGLQCDGAIPVHMVIGWPTRATQVTGNAYAAWCRSLFTVDNLVKLIEWYRNVWDSNDSASAVWIDPDRWTEATILGKHLEKLASLERTAPNGAVTQRERQRYDRACKSLEAMRAIVSQANQHVHGVASSADALEKHSAADVTNASDAASVLTEAGESNAQQKRRGRPRKSVSIEATATA